MTAGVPGSGIGGFFYLVSALLMPVQETISICQKKSSRATRRAVVRQSMNAVGVLGGVWLTGWFISKAFSMVSSSLNVQHAALKGVLRGSNLAYGLVSLLAVFLIVQVLGVLMRRAQPRTQKLQASRE